MCTNSRGDKWVFLVMLSAWLMGLPALGERLDREVIGKAEYSRRLDCRFFTGDSYLDYDFRIHHPIRIRFFHRQVEHSSYVRIRSFARAYKDEQGNPYAGTQPILSSEQRIPQKALMVNFYGGGITFKGTFPTGLGEYELVVAIDNGLGAGCVKRWVSKANWPKPDFVKELRLRSGQIGNETTDLSDPQFPTPKLGDGLRACVLLNIETRYRGSALPDVESARLALSAVRRLAEEPLVSKTAVVAFSLEKQPPPYVRPFQEFVDFDALAEKYLAVNSALVDLKALGIRSELSYLTEVMREAYGCLGGGDVVMIVSPWWRESFELNDPVLRLLNPRAGQQFVYVRPGRYYLRRGERSGASWSLQDGFSKAVAAAGGQHLNMDDPESMLKDLRRLLRVAASERQVRTR